MALLALMINALTYRLKKIIYPLEYEQFILAAAREYEVDPFLIAAVIKVESGFRPNVTSPKGARGLMQLMPGTALETSERAGIDSFDQQMLFEPELNIRLGTLYLSMLLTEFDQDLGMALAAYNGGLNRVKQWQQDGLIYPGADMSKVPFEETRNYVVRVKKSLESYRTLYRDELSI